MPVYEYECGACAHQFEEWQKITDKPVRTCPKCKAKKVERLISQTAFHLKGGGWYSDLYSTKKSAPADKGGGGEGGGGGDKSEGSKAGTGAAAPETKPAKTPDAPEKKKKDGGTKKGAAA
jgi:putative FmdB family regulatory protein